uniref:Uncharacterized protein n=1 Tax=Tanacetum cinerariifolium TaxID=118510 RepID=A0A699QMW5_TANCI|nr:hypothetical protein [Tanacetum cinerariifolium]
MGKHGVVCLCGVPAPVTNVVTVKAIPVLLGQQVAKRFVDLCFRDGRLEGCGVGARRVGVQSPPPNWNSARLTWCEWAHWTSAPAQPVLRITARMVPLIRAAVDGKPVRLRQGQRQHRVTHPEPPFPSARTWLATPRVPPARPLVSLDGGWLREQNARPPPRPIRIRSSGRRDRSRSRYLPATDPGPAGGW